MQLARLFVFYTLKQPFKMSMSAVYILDLKGKVRMNFFSFHLKRLETFYLVYISLLWSYICQTLSNTNQKNQKNSQNKQIFKTLDLRAYSIKGNCKI